MSASTPLLSVRDLKLSFRTERGLLHAVRGVSFDLRAGETLAIVGESGSGKSSVARAILGISAANAVVEGGEIRLGGQDLLRLRDAEMDAVRGQRIAMIFQDPMSALNPIMRIGDQLTEALLLRGNRTGPRVSRAEAKARAAALLEQVGIPDARRCCRRFPFELSGGMQQRIVIAIALMGDPELLVCDEPTSALDATIQAQILELLADLRRQRDLSLLLISHDLGIVAGMADRVAVMYAGRLVEIGTCEDIFLRPAHPYTWALLSAIPDPEQAGPLPAIPGQPPDLHEPPVGDAFAPRNPYALALDFEREPPLFPISGTHAAATWLLHPDAPKVQPPEALRRRIEHMQAAPADTGGRA